MSYSISKGLSRLRYQYRNSDNLKSMLSVLLDEYDTISGVCDDLLTRLDIDVSEGVQLDGIGEIVGVDRPSVETDGVATEMEDDDYRILIRAIIYANAGRATVSHIETYAEAVLDTDVTVINGVGYIALQVNGPVTDMQLSIIQDTIPLPAGIRLGYMTYSETATDGNGGFNDVDGSSDTAGAFVGLVEV